MLSDMGNYMLDQDRTTLCSGNQHIAGGKEGAWIYVGMAIRHLEGGFAESSSVLAPVQLTGQIAVRSWNSVSSSYLV